MEWAYGLPTGSSRKTAVVAHVSQSKKKRDLMRPPSKDIALRASEAIGANSSFVPPWLLSNIMRMPEWSAVIPEDPAAPRMARQECQSK